MARYLIIHSMNVFVFVLFAFVYALAFVFALGVSLSVSSCVSGGLQLSGGLGLKVRSEDAHCGIGKLMCFRYVT